MALTLPKSYAQDVTQPIKVRNGGELVFTGNSDVDTISVALYNGGAEYEPGGSVALNCIRADGVTMVVPGAVSGNVASATLTQACCAVPGMMTVVMQLTSGGTGAIFAAVYNVLPSSTDTVGDAGTIIEDAAALVADIEAATASVPANYTALLATIAPTFSDSTAYTAGDYVWYDAVLYRFTADHAAGTWTGTDATAAVIGEDVSELKSAITDNQQTFFDFAGEVAPSVKIANDFINGRRYLSGGFANASGYAVSRFAYPAGKYAVKVISPGWAAFAYVSDSQGSAIVGNWTTSNYTFTASAPFYITFNSVSSDEIFNNIVANFDIRRIVNEGGDSLKDDIDALDDRVTAVEGQIGVVEDAVDGLTDKVDEIVVYDEPVNVFDNTFVEGEQVATSSGAFVDGSTFARTGYIPVKAGVVNIGIKTYSQPATVFQHCALYDANKNKVSAFPYTGITVNNAGNLYYQTVTATVDGYIAFDILLSAVNYDYYVSQEMEPTGYKPHYEPREYINPDLLPDAQNAITASMTYGSKPPQKSAATLTSGQSLVVENNSIMKNQYMAFFAKIDGTFNGVTIGHGQESYGYYVAVDGTNMTYGSNGSAGTATAHGLTIEEYIGVIIEVDVELNVKTTIISKGGYFTKSQQINSSWRGSVFATSNGTSFADAVLTWYTNDYKCPLWAFGDSYFTLYSPTRWPYYVANKWGYNNILLNAYPGEASTRAYDDLTNALTHGTPKYILWCMGMNDPDTGSAVNATWLEKVSALLDVCNQKGITPILATIPEVSNTSYKNTYKNNWIRSSGVRYVDFAASLADVTDWLSDDGIHPSEIGGRFMALKVLADVPEIAQGK